MKTSHLTITCCFAALTAASAQNTFSIDWSAIAGGGSQQGGATGFSLTGSIGQCAPGPPGGTTAAPFGVIGGYWVLDEARMELGQTLMRRSNAVILTWDGTLGIPVVVERSADLRTWVPVSPQPTGAVFTENITAGTHRYYRLRRVIP